MDDFKEKIERGIISYYLDSDIEEIRKSLIDLDVSLELSDAKKRKYINRLKFSYTAEINQQKDFDLLKKVSLCFKKEIEKNTEKPIVYLKKMIQNNQFQVQYRNLDRLSIQDIQDIIKDQNLLEILERLENEEE